MENANKKLAIISFVIDKSDPTNPGLNNMIENQTIGGLEWFAKKFSILNFAANELLREIRVVKNRLNHGYLKMEFMICCNEKCTEKLWLAQARIHIITKNSKSYDSQKLNKCTQYFSNENSNVQMNCSFSYDTNQEHEQIVNIRIEVLRSMPSLMEFDTNLEIAYYEEQEDGQKVEKNCMIAVNKHALATFSNYFRNLFFGNWAERREQIESFKIKEEPDFDIDLFKKLIYASLTTGWMMNNELFDSMFLDNSGNDNKLKYKMAIKILKLSVKYDLPMIQNCCEEYCTSQFKDRNFSKMELLEEADNLGLQKLKERILATINAVDFSLDYGKNFQIQSRLGKRTQEELANHIENSAKRIKWGESGLEYYYNPYEDDDYDYDFDIDNIDHDWQ